MKKRFALALVAASLVAAGCSSDDDGDSVDGTTTGTTTGNADTGDTAGDGTGADLGDTDTGDDAGGDAGSSDTVTDGPDENAGPVELAVAADEGSSAFYTLFDAVFGGETFDERQDASEAWTILVPTNAAFDAAGAGDTPEDERLFLLRRHVISSGKLSTADLAALSEISVNTDDVYPITGDATSLTIGGASVLGVLGEDDNTIVYSIGGVLADTGAAQ